MGDKWEAKSGEPSSATPDPGLVRDELGMPSAAGISSRMREAAGNLYLGDHNPLGLTVDQLRGFLKAYIKSCSIEGACQSMGIDPVRLRRRRMIDPEFAEAFKSADEAVEGVIEGRLVDRALNGVEEREWEEDGVKIRRKQDYRYLEKLLKQRDPAKWGDSGSGPNPNLAGGSILQININGVTMEAKLSNEKVVKEEGTPDE